MIFDLVETPTSFFLVELPQDFTHAAWDVLHMLRDTFPSLSAYICCYGGYENAVEIMKD